MGARKHPVPKEDLIAVGKVVEMIEGLGFILHPHHLDESSLGELKRFLEITGVFLRVIHDPEVASVLEKQYEPKLSEGEFFQIFTKVGYNFHRSTNSKMSSSAAAFIAEEFLSRLTAARLIKPPWP